MAWANYFGRGPPKCETISLAAHIQLRASHSHNGHPCLTTTQLAVAVCEARHHDDTFTAEPSLTSHSSRLFDSYDLPFQYLLARRLLPRKASQTSERTARKRDSNSSLGHCSRLFSEATESSQSRQDLTARAEREDAISLLFCSCRDRYHV